MKNIDRKNKILHILRNSDTPLYSKQLCKLLNVSPRTLRYDIEEINSLEIAEIRSSRLGYEIKKDSANPLSTIVDPDYFFFLDDSEVELILYLLKNDDADIYSIAAEFYKSDSGLQMLKKKLNFFLANFSLQVIQQKNYWRIHGEEQHIRHFIAYLIHQDIRKHDFNISYLNDHYFDFSLKQLKKILDESLDESGEEKDFYLKNILINIAITVGRCRKKKYLSGDILLLNDIEQKNEITKKIIDFTDISLSINDLAVINDQLKQVKEYAITLIYSEAIESALSQTEESFLLTPNQSSSKQDLIKKIEFILDNQSSYFFHNDFFEPIKSYHLIFFEAAVHLSLILQDESEELNISEESIGMIALHMSLCYSESSVFPSKLTAQIICPDYDTLRQYIEKRIKKQFENSIDILGFSNSFFETNVDLIVNTTSLSTSLDNAVSVSPTLDKEDLHKIESAIFKRFQHNAKKKLIANLKNNKSFHMTAFEEIDEVTDYALKLWFFENKHSYKEIKSSIEKRLSIASCTYFNRVTIFLIMSPLIKSNISIIKNKQAIFINNTEVSNYFVFVLSNSESRNKDLSSLKILLGYFRDNRKFADIMLLNSRNELLKILKSQF